MLTRREVLIGAGVGAAAALAGSVETAFATAPQPKTPVNFDVPKEACDCHTHIFGDAKKFPFASGRTYTPESASVEEMRQLHRALHTDRVVVVQPSVYGTDNSCTLDTIRQLGPVARGVAVIDEKFTTADLDDMHRHGVRGIRINLETAGQADPAVAKQRFREAIEQIATRKDWHIQIYTRPTVIVAIADDLASSPVPVSFDHFGGAQADLGVGQPGFGALVNLVKTGKAYVKVSAPYRSSKLAPDYPDIVPFAKALIGANPQRILWASDWPHPQQIAGLGVDQISPPYAVDDGLLFNHFAEWVPDAARRRTILLDNPATLYGF
ncbi:MAG TPA: amidohydrolase family protein [Candidatus Acidoferrum sp.]|nr:amidohydrolase family protein [Candidatus Acidoferrum sp.]